MQGYDPHHKTEFHKLYETSQNSRLQLKTLFFKLIVPMLQCYNVKTQDWPDWSISSAGAGRKGGEVKDESGTAWNKEQLIGTES